MKLSTFASIPFKYRLACSLALAASLLGTKVQAQVFYISETNASTSAMTLLEYKFTEATSSTAASASFVNSFTQPGLNGAPSGANQGYLQYVNGTTLDYSGYSSGSGTHAEEVLFNTSTSTFNSITTLTGSGSTIRSSYYGTNTAGTSGYFVTTGSAATGFAPVGSTGAPKTIVSDQGNANQAGTSENEVTYNPLTSNLYFTRNTSGGFGGVYTPSTNGLGLVSSPTNFTALSGTGWNGANAYTGLTFLGSNELFVADTTTNTLDFFMAANPNITTDWNLVKSLQLSSSTAIEGVSVTQVGANKDEVFYTTNGNTTEGLSLNALSTVNEVDFSAAGGFGTPVNLLSSRTVYFTGVASDPTATPEPGTFAMVGVGLALMGVLWARKRASLKTTISESASPSETPILL